MDHITPDAGFFRSPATRLAPALIGCLLRRVAPEGMMSGVIVETEAYTSDDPASHSYGGETSRNWPMFRGGGLAYVYLIYGIHNCFNVTSGVPGSGEAVLVRALEPCQGTGLMMDNRGVRDPELLCSGPGRLCQAMGIDRSMNGSSLLRGELQVLLPSGTRQPRISVSGRIGISRARELQRRFFLSGSRWVSGRR